METLASKTGLLPEQSWDEADQPDLFMWLGKPTGSAMPLMWAHAEYIKLLRSTTDGRVYDIIPEVAARYLGKRPERKRLQVWKPNRHVRFMKADETLRIHAEAAFTLHWSADGWKTATDTKSTTNSLQIDFVDLNNLPLLAGATICFTFLWASGHWEGQDYSVSVVASGE
jgi:glucoamylase